MPNELAAKLHCLINTRELSCMASLNLYGDAAEGVQCGKVRKQWDVKAE